MGGKTTTNITNSVFTMLAFDYAQQEPTNVTLNLGTSYFNLTNNITIPGQIHVTSYLHVAGNLSLAGVMSAQQANISVAGSLYVSSLELNLSRLHLSNGAQVHTPQLNLMPKSVLSTLGYPGTIIGNVSNGGTVAVLSHRSLVVKGNYTQLPGGIFNLIELDPTNTTHTPLIVNGSVFLNGSIGYSVVSGFTSMTTFLVIASYNVSGFYENQPTDRDSDTIGTTTYDGQHVYLKIADVDPKFWGLEWFMWLIVLSYCVLLGVFVCGVACNKQKYYLGFLSLVSTFCL